MGQNFLGNAVLAFIDERGLLRGAGDSVVHCWVAVGRFDGVFGLDFSAERGVKLLGFFSGALVHQSVGWGGENEDF